MTDVKQEFINLIKLRSQENREFLSDDFQKGRIGKCISTLREELDSFIRVIYLGRISNIHERERLMNQTLIGEEWRVLRNNQYGPKIRDFELVRVSNDLKGYIHYVYKFGCGFIHLSNYHLYSSKNPFEQLSISERSDIKYYLNQYHNFPLDYELNIENITNYIPSIFDKISSNLNYYFDMILTERMID